MAVVAEIVVAAVVIVTMKTDDMMQTQNENYKNYLKRLEMVKHRGNH